MPKVKTTTSKMTMKRLIREGWQLVDSNSRSTGMYGLAGLQTIRSHTTYVLTKPTRAELKQFEAVQNTPRSQ